MKTWMLLAELGAEGPLSATAVRLAATLREATSDQYPGDTKLAQLFGVSHQAVRNARHQLENAELVRFHGQGKARRFEWLVSPGPSSRMQEVYSAVDHVMQFRSCASTEQARCASEEATRESSPIAAEPSPAPDSTLPEAPSAAVAQQTTLPEKEPGLTRDEQQIVLQSAENIRRWLNWGPAAIRQGSTEGLPYTKDSWLRHVESDEVAHLDQWKPFQFAAFYWWRVCRWREEQGIPLTCPFFEKAGRGRLMGEVDRLLKAGTKEQVLDYFCMLTHHFDLVRFRLGRWGSNLVLDETTLGMRPVQQVVMEMSRWTEEQIDAEYERMAQVQQQQQVFHG